VVGVLLPFLLLQLRNPSVTLILLLSARSPIPLDSSLVNYLHVNYSFCCLLNNNVDHCSISRIVAIRKLMLSTRLFFRSEMKQGSDFCVFLHSHARSVIIGDTLPC
jgi:hypothetical protein